MKFAWRSSVSGGTSFIQLPAPFFLGNVPNGTIDIQLVAATLGSIPDISLGDTSKKLTLDLRCFTSPSSKELGKFTPIFIVRVWLSSS